MKILLDNAIYNDGPPDIVKGHLFVYEVTAIQNDEKTVTLTIDSQKEKNLINWNQQGAFPATLQLQPCCIHF